MKNLFGKDEEDLEEVKGNKTKERNFGYKPFALQDAIGEKSAKKVWIEYQKLRLQGIEAEELVYKIVSKVRDMTAIKRGANGKSLGISNDWLFNKSQKASKNWKERELNDFYTRLVAIFHESRMGYDELDIALEKVLLGI